MSRTFTKVVSILLITVIMFSAMPLAQPKNAITANASALDTRQYDPLPDKEAQALLGFLYNVDELTPEMKSAGDLQGVRIYALRLQELHTFIHGDRHQNTACRSHRKNRDR